MAKSAGYTTAYGKRRWRHVSQWIDLPGGSRSGGEGCAEASLTRAILEYDPNTPNRRAMSNWHLASRVHDPHDSYGEYDLMDQISLWARGEHLGPYDSPTYVSGIEKVLNLFFPGDWSAHYVSNEGIDVCYAGCYATPMSILWVDGSIVSKDYQGSYFGGLEGQGNHIMCWPPALGGLDPVNNPLADLPDMATDTTYAANELKSMLYGYWALPKPEPLVQRAMVTHTCALKPTPTHTSVSLQTLFGGASVSLLNIHAQSASGRTIENWERVSFAPAGKPEIIGWVPAANLKIT